MSDGPLRVALTTLGCKVNFAEMAELAGRLAAAGCDIVDDHEPAEVRVVNSCTVTSQADATTRKRLHRLRHEDPSTYLILTGCSVDGNPDRYRAGATDGVDAVFPNARKPLIAEHIAGIARARNTSGTTRPAPSLRSRAFIKVQDGCDHRCTYCIVWRARGPSNSVPPEEVLRRARVAVAAGHQEIVLAGVDIGSYGKREGTDLAALVARLLEDVPEARLRISSINANDISRELISLNAHERVCPHWHIPLQSGSDAILAAMHRGYRRRQFLRVVDELRIADPLTEITTDIMVGFPGETDADHGRTLDVVDAVGFLHAHVFRYSPRPDTPASALPGRTEERTSKRRSAEVMRAAARTGHASRERAVGRIMEVVWDHVDGHEARGTSATWHTVVAAMGTDTVYGGRQRVRIAAVDGDALRATLLPS